MWWIFHKGVTYILHHRQRCRPNYIVREHGSNFLGLFLSSDNYGLAKPVANGVLAMGLYGQVTASE